MSAGVRAILVKNEFCIGEFSAPCSKAVEVEFVVVDQIDVDVQPLRAVRFALVGGYNVLLP